jgi:hypothetical protein
MGPYDNDDFNPDNVILTNNPYDIDINTGYNDNYISSSTVLMDADEWDNR